MFVIITPLPFVQQENGGESSKSSSPVLFCSMLEILRSCGLKHGSLASRCSEFLTLYTSCSIPFSAAISTCQFLTRESRRR